MSSKLEPVIWLRVLVTLAYMKGRTDVRTYVRMYVRTDLHDVMAIKPNFLTSMGYQQRRLLSDWLLKIVVSSFPTARCDVNKDGFRSGDFNLCFFDRSI